MSKYCRIDDDFVCPPRATTNIVLPTRQLYGRQRLQHRVYNTKASKRDNDGFALNVTVLGGKTAEVQHIAQQHCSHYNTSHDVCPHRWHCSRSVRGRATHGRHTNMHKERGQGKRAKGTNMHKERGPRKESEGNKITLRFPAPAVCRHCPSAACSRGVQVRHDVALQRLEPERHEVRHQRPR